MKRSRTPLHSPADKSPSTLPEALTLLGEYKEALDELRKKYEEVLERYIRLERGFRPPTSERKEVVNEQLSLAMVGLSLASRDAGAEPSSENASKVPASSDDAPKPMPPAPEEERPHQTGRKPLPRPIPRVVVTLLPPEVEREGTNAFLRIGEETSEVLERCRGSLVVIQTVRPKFIRKGERPALEEEESAEAGESAGSAEAGSLAVSADSRKTVVLIAPKPTLPIEKGLAGPGLLAETVVKRWGDHLPLHRQEGIWAREGWEVARSTVCSWQNALSDLVAPLLTSMWNHARGQPWLLTDATSVKVQAKLKCKTGYFFVVIAPEQHVLFQFTREHNGKAIQKILGSFRGHLVADAHTIYDHLYALEQCTEVGCWSHVRRYFFKAISTDPVRAAVALDLIGQCFRVERQIAKLPPQSKRRERQEQSKPRVETFFAWCKEQEGHVLEHSPISAAVTYATNQKAALHRFLEDGRLPMHNNSSERELRRQAVGRKNWLFVGSDDGGDANARFMSLLASCQLHQIEPWEYLRDLFCLLPDWPIQDVLSLAPAFWKKTSARTEVIAKLESNLYRRIADTYAAGPDPKAQKKETDIVLVNDAVR